MTPSFATNGYVFTLRRARKEFTCCVCGEIIARDESYCEVTIGGGGLGSLKFPDRIHVSEIEGFIKKKVVGHDHRRSYQD